MKRVLGMLSVIGLTALITYLAVTRYLSDQRAARLDRALLEAEQRIVQLEAEIDAAKSQLSEIADARSRSSSRSASSPTTKNASSSDRSQQGRGTPEISTPEVVVGTSRSVVASGSEPSVAWIRYAAASSADVTNLVRIEGTSSIHDWQVEGHLIGGSAEFGAGFPPTPKYPLTPGGVDAKVGAFIPVRSLRSVESDGSPYSDAMDEVMYDKLREHSNRRITFVLSSFTPKEQSSPTVAPYLYDATGSLAVAGRTNSIRMQITVTPHPSGRIMFTGSTRVKMSDFEIVPPSPSFGGVSIKTGDEVTVRFVWWVNRLGKSEASR